jgi:hypothetical protein
VSVFDRGSVYNADYSDPNKSPAENLAKLYPNVRGCGYPPELNCEEFYEFYKNKTDYPCWVSTMDSSVAMTQLDLERAKSEVLFSLVPLLIFIVFVLYAFCRMGVFAVCNPMRMCPKSPDTKIELPNITPKKLLNYKRGLVAKKNVALAAFQDTYNFKPPDPGDGGPMGGGVAIPATIIEDPEDDTTPSEAAEDSGNQRTVITSAEVLPRLPTSDSSVVRSRNNSTKIKSSPLEAAEADNLSLIEQELFSKDRRKSFACSTKASIVPDFRTSGLHAAAAGDDEDNKSDTNTVINDLFGDELERMDRERLASRYDVLDLKDLDLEPYDGLYKGVRFSGSGGGPNRRRSSNVSDTLKFKNPTHGSKVEQQRFNNSIRSGVKLRRDLGSKSPAGSDSFSSYWDDDKDDDFGDIMPAAAAGLSSTSNSKQQSTRAKHL